MFQESYHKVEVEKLPLVLASIHVAGRQGAGHHFVSITATFSDSTGEHTQEL